MKKTLFLGLILAASVQMFGASAQDLLKEARNDYYKNLKVNRRVRSNNK